MKHCTTFLAIFLLASTTFAANNAATQSAEGIARPAQTPVLAANTVLHANVPYGGPDEKLNVLDIYAPASAAKSPVILFVHGGEWSRGDKADISCKPKFFNEHNILFVATNYRLSPKNPHPAQVTDVATAIAWVHTHIAEYGGDPAQIVLMGHSAGCHLVTLVSLDPTYLRAAGLKPTDIKATVAWSGGMYDLVDRANGGGMYPPFIKATFGTSPDAQRAASPMTFTPNAKDAPPFLFASVDDEKSKNSRAATAAIVAKINAAGGHATSILLEHKTHFTANHEFGAPNDQSSSQFLAFLTSLDK